MVNYSFNVAIGDNVFINPNVIISSDVRIGNDVFISVSVGMTNDNAIGKLGFEKGKIIGPTIKDGAAIGAGAILLPGVVIGKDSVVGAGSVVTKDVVDHSVVMGIPARQKNEMKLVFNT